MEKKSNIATRGMKWGAVSLGALIIAAPNLVMAQDAPEAKNSETVVVTGLRGALTKSINAKRNNTSIVEAISAEDIGKLPEPSIAEALARLPGIMGQRVGGDVQVINVRGTSPDFTVTTLNGRPQGSLGDARGVEIDQYPAELMGGVVVYKTPDAAISGMGLSGTVDLRSLRPLSRNGRSIVVNLSADTTSLPQLHSDVKKNGWRGSASYVNQFMDGKLGVALGYAHLDTTNQTQHQKRWGWVNPLTTPPAWNNDVVNYMPGASNAVRSANVLTGFEAANTTTHKVRDGLMGTFEYKPNDNSHTTVDLYYSKFKQDLTSREIMANTFWTGNQGVGIPNAGATLGSIGGTPTITSGTFNNLQIIQLNRVNSRDDSVFSGGINHEFKAGIWDLVADFSHSESKGDEQESETYQGYGATSPSLDPAIKFAMDSEGFIQMAPTLNYNDSSKMNLGDVAGWGHDGLLKKPHVDDKYTTFALKGKTSIKNSFLGGLFSEVEVGLDTSSHDKTKSVDEWDLFLNARGTSVLRPPTDQRNSANFVRVSPASLGVGSTDFGWMGFGQVFAYDLNGAMNSLYRQVFIDASDQNHWTKNWTLNEEVYDIFTKFNIDSEFMGHHLGGNIGVQFVNTDTESTGDAIITNNNGGNLTPTHVVAQNKYTDLLPSLNLSIDLTKNMKFRIGIAKQMARPRPDDLRANTAAGLSALSTAEIIASGLPAPATSAPADQYYKYSGSGGNPYLRPWRDTAFDASYEWYLKRHSMIALAGFYKEVKTYIYSQTIDFDFSSVPNPLGRKIPSTIGKLTTPQNGEGGWIKGYEFQAKLDFGDFVPVLDGFGFDGSYSRNFTNIHPNGPGTTATLPGFSGISRSLTAYYEKHGFQARISERWRSASRSDVAGLFATRTFTQILPDTQVDAQISYKFSEGALNGMSVMLQATNLTDAPYRTGAGIAADGSYLPEVYEKYGARYILGVSYKF